MSCPSRMKHFLFVQITFCRSRYALWESSLSNGIWLLCGKQVFNFSLRSNTHELLAKTPWMEYFDICRTWFIVWTISQINYDRFSKAFLSIHSEIFLSICFYDFLKIKRDFPKYSKKLCSMIINQAPLWSRNAKLVQFKTSILYSTAFFNNLSKYPHLFYKVRHF